MYLLEPERSTVAAMTSPGIYVRQDMHQEARTYFEKKHINEILESIVTGLIFVKPEDPLTFIEECVGRIRRGDLIGKSRIRWDQFIPGAVKEATEKRREMGRKGFPTHPEHKGLKRLQPLVQLPPLPPLKGAFMMPDISVKPLISKVNQTGKNEKKDEAASKSEIEGEVLESTVPAAVIDHPNIFFVLGGPGSGKGTQCERLAKEFNLCHLSTGDLLRKEVQNGTEIGRKCEELMKEGKIVPMANFINFKTLQDGFPRAMDQAVEFEKSVARCRAVLFFECPLDVLEARLLERGKTSGRADDNIETIKKRFQTFMDQSVPAVAHFEESGRVITISSTAPIDEVYKKARTNFLHLLPSTGIDIGPATTASRPMTTMATDLTARPATTTGVKTPLPPISRQSEVVPERKSSALPAAAEATDVAPQPARGGAWNNIVFVLG
ncbi:hypothetical protein HK405_001324 [Cladochytrium tenue]|nr:hypothetical protein HK405_001324 [Cladochytrium tenue]